jgi:ubiquinone/menaquinone biosynthesis C-methylase UbiE
MSDFQRSEAIRRRYNAVSDTYDQRYEINPLNGVGEALRDLVRSINALRVLEVGCGTGYWLKSLQLHVRRIVGLDSSIGMLQRSFPLPGSAADLVCGSADSLPFTGKSFDLIFVVNAIHHFEDKQGFIDQARRLLRPDGALAVVAMDIPSAIGHSVIYDYFPGTREFDQTRFPPWEAVEAWMCRAELLLQPLQTVEHVCYERRGAGILEDHFIQRCGASSFMRMTDRQYEVGIDRIKSAIAEAEARGEVAVFRTEFDIKMMVGHVPNYAARCK